MKENRFNHLTDTQLAYMAAFIDCNGSIFAEIKPGEYVLKYRIIISLVFYQKKSRKHFLKKIQKELKTGVLRDSGDISDLTLSGVEIVVPFLQKIKAFVRIKTKQLNLMLRLIEQLPQIQNNSQKFIEVCEIADRIAKLNDLKNRKITVHDLQKVLIPVETE